MDLKAYFEATKPKERRALAEKIGTSEEYLRLCANGHRQTGTTLALKLVAAEPRLKLADLRPDIWGQAVAA
ncbi:hypothetical protein E5S69_11730 [Cupriavidus necator]|uniref:hypothetical protein n=1 Tax=Cupriavidus necator TaxID=106590 RepID=UPI00148F6884|nr:hypothetical protein [Cupriavidus necator]NOV24182.1 hypothetical protein [Cupriavidus necator]